MHPLRPAPALLLAFLALTTGLLQAQSPGFNTDYRTRSPHAVAPVSIQGKGIGGRNLPIGQEDAWRGNLPADFCPTDLVRIHPYYCYGDMPIFLRQEAANSLQRMFYDAARQGLKLQIVSGYRDYTHQMRLYTEAVRRRGKNQKTVARPGRSEHFLGTTADVTNGEKRHTLSRSFAQTPEGRWLARNADRYGWKMTVMSGNGRRSHNDEPWHIRYLGPRATGGNPQLAGTRKPGIFQRLGRIFRR